ncbi:MAG: hypothetical protein WBQ24_02390 [Xanthobacteraceae bacterium]
MMRCGAFFIDLPENCRSVIERLPAPFQKTSVSAFDRLGKCQFGSRKNANSNPSIIRASESARTSAEVPRGQFVAYSCWS